MQALQGVHIIEGIIQLLTDSLVFELLSVQLVCSSKGREKAGGRCRTMKTKEEEKERNHREKIKAQVNERFNPMFSKEKV